MHIEKKKKKEHCPVLWTSKTALFQKSSRGLKSVAKPNTFFLDKSSEKQRIGKKLTDPALIYTDTVKASVFDKLQVNKDRQKGEKYIKQDSSEVYSCAEITRRSPPAWLWWCHHGY